MDDITAIFSLNNWPGHLSYVLIAVSYWLTDMFWLRLVAIVGLSLDAYQLYRLLQDRLSLRLPQADRELLCSVLTGLDDAQIARLLVAGWFSDIAKCTTLAEENKQLDKLFFICAGHVRVTIADREVLALKERQLRW